MKWVKIKNNIIDLHMHDKSDNKITAVASTVVVAAAAVAWQYRGRSGVDVDVSGR